jgi:hypothetical protein
MHWLENAAARAGIPGAKRVNIPANASRAAAWEQLVRVRRLSERAPTERVAPVLRVPIADLKLAGPASIDAALNGAYSADDVVEISSGDVRPCCSWTTTQFYVGSELVSRLRGNRRTAMLPVMSSPVATSGTPR